MPATTEPRYWTPDDVWAMPDDGCRYECIDGVLLVSPSPRPRHQFVLGALFARLHPYVLAEKVGRALTSPADIRLEASNVVQPDLFVIPRAAVAAAQSDWIAITSLLLAVEVQSPSTARYDRGLKRAYYQRGKVTEYWIVDPDARLIERWRHGEPRPEVETGLFTWHPVGAAAPLQIDVAKLFAEALEA